VAVEEPQMLAVGDAQFSRELRAMLPLGRAVLRGGELSDVLDRIAEQAAGVVAGADRASVILVEGSEHRFRLGGSYGLSDRYRRELTEGTGRLRPGEGPSGVAYVRRSAVVISDVRTDPIVREWSGRDLVVEENYGAIVSLPLILDGHFAGTLNLYRIEPGPWPPDQVRVLAFFADHAASAVRTAQLLDQRGKQVLALRRLVSALREQAHEHVNRLHAISGLLALDEVEEAKGLVQRLENLHTETRSAVDSRIHVPVVAGFVLAETMVAAQRGIRLELDRRSALNALPGTLSDTQVLTILGNLLDNALHAVADQPPERRLVRLLMKDRDDATVIEVADHGPGIVGDAAAMFDRGHTTKDGHAGVGLALVREATSAAMGSLDVDTSPAGTTFRITFNG
jgi:anti-sigma regulatory factor (Ser/Thr protein kinase)